MKIRSLGRQTDLIFARFAGEIIRSDHYTLIQTRSNPGYHWGNFIIFDRAPQKGDLKKWTELFDQKFPYYSKPDHYTFTWDTETDDPGEYEEFLKANFDFESVGVLTSDTPKPPPHPRDDLKVRKLCSPADWEQATKLQLLCEDRHSVDQHYVDFKNAQMKNYQKMADAGMGNWFGAFLGDTLVGDLGIFFENQIGRYQSVGTHPDYRKQGVCGTLVYEAALIALKEFGVKTLVMEADENYHAARVYESVGFEKRERNYSLNWWEGKNS